MDTIAREWQQQGSGSRGDRNLGNTLFFSFKTNLTRKFHELENQVEKVWILTEMFFVTSNFSLILLWRAEIRLRHQWTYMALCLHILRRKIVDKCVLMLSLLSWLSFSEVLKLVIILWRISHSFSATLTIKGVKWKMFLFSTLQWWGSLIVAEKNEGMRENEENCRF